MEKHYINKWYYGHSLYRMVDPYNPLNLPPNTVRVRTNDGNVPIKGKYATYDTATLVPGTTDVYDVYKRMSSNQFMHLLEGATNVIEVLGANTSEITMMFSMFNGCTSLTTVALFDTSKVTTMTDMFGHCSSLTSVPLFNTSNVTGMLEMFWNCYSLTNVPLFDTSKVTNMGWMFASCTSLTSVPLFDTSKVTNMYRMFTGCTKVESGALALYNQASTQSNPPTNHAETFRNCGSNTVTGAAELAQIPSDWK